MSKSYVPGDLVVTCVPPLDLHDPLKDYVYIDDCDCDYVLLVLNIKTVNVTDDILIVLSEYGVGYVYSSEVLSRCEISS